MVNNYKVTEPKILLVEDNAADIRLTEKALQNSQIVSIMHIARDGVEAIDFLKKRGKFSNASSPNLIFLDLNLPKKNGFEVLKEIKQNEDLKRIPVVILTISDSEEDIKKAYNLHTNCYIIKPLEIKDFYKVVNSIIDFWFKIVKFPED